MAGLVSMQKLSFMVNSAALLFTEKIKESERGKSW